MAFHLAAVSSVLPGKNCSICLYPVKEGQARRGRLVAHPAIPSNLIHAITLFLYPRYDHFVHKYCSEQWRRLHPNGFSCSVCRILLANQLPLNFPPTFKRRLIFLIQQTVTNPILIPFAAGSVSLAAPNFISHLLIGSEVGTMASVAASILLQRRSRIFLAISKLMMAATAGILAAQGGTILEGETLSTDEIILGLAGAVSAAVAVGATLIDPREIQSFRKKIYVLIKAGSAIGAISIFAGLASGTETVVAKRLALLALTWVNLPHNTVIN